MKVLIVLAHPRENSLAHSIKNKFEKGLTDSGHQVTTLDLFKVGFDPVLREDDEPHYDQVEQKFSQEVHEEMERINQHDAIVFVFPLYWSNMPAIMKGYLDRVWNLGFAYSYLSPNTMKVKKVFFMTTTGSTEDNFIKRDHFKFINHYFNNVVAGYCKVENSRVKIFNDAHNEELVINNHLPQSYQEGLDFDKW